MLSPNEIKFLLNIVTILLARSNGEIRVSAAELHNTEPAKGFEKRWDNDTRELVLRTIAHESVLYLDDLLPQQPSQPQPQLSPAQIRAAADKVEQLVEEAWTGKPRKPQPSQQTVIVDDERAADLEQQRRKESALRQILEFQPPEPHQRPTPPSTRSWNSSPAPAKSQLPETYFLR